MRLKVSYFHHDIFNARFNPRRSSPLTATFPVGDSQFTLVNALSVVGPSAASTRDSGVPG